MVEPETGVRDQKSEISALGPNGQHDLGPVLRAAPRFAIGRDALNRAVMDLSESQRTALERFWRWCNEHGVDRKRLGTLLRKANGKDYYSPDSIYQALTGRRTEAGSSLEPICRSIEQFLRNVEPQTGATTFIETDLAKQMWRYMYRVKELRDFGFIFGDMSIGKSDAAVELCRRDPDSLYTEMPTRGQLTHLLQEVAPALAMGDRQTLANMRHRVFEGLPGLWVVDEADRCFAAIRNCLGLATLEFIREAWNYRRRTGRPIAVVFIMDHFGRDQLLKGTNADRLKRLFRRRYRALQLPNTLSSRDLARFADAVGLPPAPNNNLTTKAEVLDKSGEPVVRSFTDNPARLQKEMIVSHGLHIWKQVLNEAADIAKHRRRPIAWEAVIKAHAVFTAEEAYTDQEKANEEVMS